MAWTPTWLKPWLHSHIQYTCTGDSTCFLPPPEPDCPPPESRWLVMDLAALRAESTTPCAVLGPMQTHQQSDYSKYSISIHTLRTNNMQKT